MPFDGIFGSREALWDGFGRYIRAAYRNNSYHLATTTAWFDELRGREVEPENLRLAFVEVCNELTGQKFYAFSINEQMFFSRHPAVLTLACPRSADHSPNVIYPDRLVGVYLHDFGYDEKIFSACAENARKFTGKRVEERLRGYALDGPIALAELKQEMGGLDAGRYARGIAKKIRKKLNNPMLPGGVANKIDLCELRFAATSPFASIMHRDRAIGSWNCWTRVVAHGFIGPATLFALYGNNERGGISPGLEITCPTGATSAHLGFLLKSSSTRLESPYGVEHQSVGDIDGRVILIKPDMKESADCWGLIKPEKSTPWRTRRLSPVFI